MAKTQIAGSVVAGFPSPAEQYLEPALDLNELLVKRPAATHFVRVQGDSMIGRGIHDGDLLVVDRSLDPRDGDVVIAAVDGDFTVKTLRKVMKEIGGTMKRTVSLEAANPAYPAIILKGASELQLFGKVIAVIHRL